MVVPFYQEDPENYIGWVSSDFHVSTSWINVEPNENGDIPYADFARDYAVINLLPESHPAQEFGWFAIRNYDHEVGEGVNVSGFPESLQTHPLDWGFDLYKSLGTLTLLDSYLFEHNALAERGNSGSPVFNQKEGTLAAIGIHNSGSPDDPEINTAARIIGYTYNNITYWSGLN
ncbi:MAG: trypsin-like peptidase domain-containing protein [Thermoactinomyces sp.]